VIEPTISPILTFSQEIVEDLEAALEQFLEIANDLGGKPTKETTENKRVEPGENPAQMSYI
jgi:hypothetical protein